MSAIEDSSRQPDDRAFREPSSTWALDNERLSVDPVALRDGRLSRLRALMQAKDYAGCVLFDPFNQRYATGSRNMFLYYLRNGYRYIFVSADGPIVSFDYPQSEHVSAAAGAVDEVRISNLTWSSFMGQDDTSSVRFAEEIADLVKEHGRGSKKIGLDRCVQRLAVALERFGCQVVDFQQDAHFVRRIKTPEELSCLKLSLVGTETSIDKVREAIRPGVTDQQLLGKMLGSVVEEGGEFIETRLFSSGHRTNPWFQEAGPKQVRPGDLVAIDTDTIGCFGYYSDISRTFHCGPGRPTTRQKTLYQTAYDQIQHNLSIIKPGMTFRELGDKAWKIPDKYLALRYPVLMHGIGMHGEAPTVHHAVDFHRYGSDGLIEPGMVMCVESYIGEEGGEEGVKLEEEFIVTENGIQVISRYPFEEDLLFKEI